MASLHERLYQQDNITAVKFNAVIQDIFSQINKSDIIDKQVKDNIHANADIELNADKAIPLGLIVNELITNSYKYAFEKTIDPLVELNISKVNNTLTIHYKDNGKGLHDTSGINTQSYGFKLIKGLSSQLNGSYRFWNDAGFNFELVIPV